MPCSPSRSAKFDHVKVQHFPANYTSKLQPLDLTNFKVHFNSSIYYRIRNGKSAASNVKILILDTKNVV